MNPLLQKGIAALRNGDKTTAQNIFRQALQQQPNDETAWLWLAGTFDENTARIHCLKKVLAINPANLAAQKALAQLTALEVPPPFEQAPVESQPTESPVQEVAIPDDNFNTDGFDKQTFEGESGADFDQGSIDLGENTFTEEQQQSWEDAIPEQSSIDDAIQDHSEEAGNFAESIFDNATDQKEDDWLRSFTDDTFLAEVQSNEESGPGSLAESIFGSEPDQKEDDWLRSFSNDAFLDDSQNIEENLSTSFTSPITTGETGQLEEVSLGNHSNDLLQEGSDEWNTSTPNIQETAKSPQDDNDEEDWVNIFSDQAVEKELPARRAGQHVTAASSLQSSELFDQTSRAHMLQADEEDLHIRALQAKPMPRGRYAIQIPGFEDHEILLKPTMLAMPKLLFDGKPVKRDKPSKLFALTSNEGLIAKINLRPSFFDPLPKIWVDDEKLTLAPPLKWYQWVWMGIPLVALTVLGGAIGAFIGLLALTINIKVFRSRLPVILRYMLTIFITLLAVALYLAAAIYLPTLLQGL